MASNRYNYVLTESAEADIDEAFDYLYFPIIIYKHKQCGGT